MPPQTGTARFATIRQFIPHGAHDYDVTHVGPVFKTAIGGSTKNVVASTGKDGVLRLLNGNSTDILYSVPFTNRINAEAPITTTPVRVCPASVGGQEWNGSAYHVKLNVLVAPATDWCAEFKKDTSRRIRKRNTRTAGILAAKRRSIRGQLRVDDSLRSMLRQAKRNGVTMPRNR